MAAQRGFVAGYGFALLLACATSAAAQQVNVGTPFQNIGSNYYERFGVGFGGRIGGVHFNNGGMGALPPFGGHNPANDARFGFGLRGGGINANFGFAAGAGSDRFINSVTPSVTVMNGGTGTIFSGQQRPFVTGLVPLVGSFAPGIGHTMMEPRVVSPLADRVQRLEAEGYRPGGAPASEVVERPAFTSRGVASTAERGDLSLAEIRAAQGSVVDPQIAERDAYLAAAQELEEAGQLGPALVEYGRAALRADEGLKAEIRAKMAQLREEMKQRK